MKSSARKLPFFMSLVLLAFVSGLVVRAYAADDGAATFKSKCVMCHGADAAGKTPMGARLNIKDLTSPEVQKQSDADLAGVIAKGRNKMPEYGSKLSKEQTTDIVKYIRTLAKK